MNIFDEGRYKPSRNGEAGDEATSYIAPVRTQHMSRDSVVEYDYYLLFGTVEEIRHAVYRLHRMIE